VATSSQLTQIRTITGVMFRICALQIL
jgi:hypothetical protein